MKKMINSLNLRRTAGLALIVFTTGILFNSCKKNSDADTTITSDEISEAVTESVGSTSGGMITQTESTSVMANSNNLVCGATSDTTVIGQSVAGALISYNYSLKFSRTRICTNNIPSQVNFNFTGTSSYSAPRMSSADNSNAQFVVTGLGASSTAFIVNGNYVRNGTQQSKVGLKRSFSSTITVTSSNVNVSKSTQKIVSGTATIQFTGSVSGGATNTRAGVLVFLGNAKGTLTLENGSVYNLQW